MPLSNNFTRRVPRFAYIVDSNDDSVMALGLAYASPLRSPPRTNLEACNQGLRPTLNPPCLIPVLTLPAPEY
jgi:hypothetical protein